MGLVVVFFFSSRRRHTRCGRDWSSDVCSSDLASNGAAGTTFDAQSAVSPGVLPTARGRRPCTTSSWRDSRGWKRAWNERRGAIQAILESVMPATLMIPYAQPSFFGAEEAYLVEAFRSTWISGGAFVDRFEEDFRRYCGTRYAVTASNGTTALHMAYLALGIKHGDEVIVPGFGFLAAANIALHVGARAVCAEVDPDTWCMTAREIEPCISPRTRLIVPVHTYGNVCDMDPILSLARHYRIAVVEDAAEAFPSRYRGRLAGTLGRP